MYNDDNTKVGNDIWTIIFKAFWGWGRGCSVHVFTKGEHLISYSITVPYSFVIGSLTEPGARLAEIPCLPIPSTCTITSSFPT